MEKIYYAKLLKRAEFEDAVLLAHEHGFPDAGGWSSELTEPQCVALADALDDALVTIDCVANQPKVQGERRAKIESLVAYLRKCDGLDFIDPAFEERQAKILNDAYGPGTYTPRTRPADKQVGDEWTEQRN